MKMKAAVMTGYGQPLEIKEVELAEPKANEVLVKIAATGVCHSDLNALDDKTTPIPTVLGHEGAGIVEAVGANVKNVKPGDKVALSWVPYCGTCEFCITGNVHLCESAFGPMFDGTLLDGTSRLSCNGEKVYHNSLLSTFASIMFFVSPLSSAILTAKMSAPAFASASAKPCPNPEFPPVIMATFPFKLKKFIEKSFILTFSVFMFIPSS